jgi:hypothetical protein
LTYLRFVKIMVDVAQLAERAVVVRVVAGSNPVVYPKGRWLSGRKHPAVNRVRKARWFESITAHVNEREKTYYAWEKAGWKFRIGDYYGALCVTLDGPGLWADADFNRRFPYGICLGVNVGRKRSLPGAEHLRMPRAGFGLDLNAHFGEPNRLHLTGLRRRWTIGLLEWHEQVETGARQEMIAGQERTVHVMERVRCRPRIVRAQGWDWDTNRALDSQDSRSWRWIVSHPVARPRSSAG